MTFEDGIKRLGWTLLFFIGGFIFAPLWIVAAIGGWFWLSDVFGGASQSLSHKPKPAHAQNAQTNPPVAQASKKAGAAEDALLARTKTERVETPSALSAHQRTAPVKLHEAAPRATLAQIFALLSTESSSPVEKHTAQVGSTEPGSRFTDEQLAQFLASLSDEAVAPDAETSIPQKPPLQSDPDHLVQAIHDGRITPDNISVDAIFGVSRIARDLWNEMRRGTAILPSADHCDQYLWSYGKMVKSQWDIFLDSSAPSIDADALHVIDYGCGQGLACAILLDRASTRGEFKQFTLIEPSVPALRRAEAIVRCYCPDAQVVGINKRFDDVMHGDIPQSSAQHGKTAVLHLFSNVLDIGGYDQFRLIETTLGGTSKAAKRHYFLAVSHDRNFDGGSARIHALENAIRNDLKNAIKIHESTITQFKTSNGNGMPAISWLLDIEFTA